MPRESRAGLTRDDHAPGAARLWCRRFEQITPRTTALIASWAPWRIRSPAAMSLVAANGTLGLGRGLTETVAGSGSAERGPLRPPCTGPNYWFFGSRDSGGMTLEVRTWRIRRLVSLEDAETPSKGTECQVCIPAILVSSGSGPPETERRERKGKLFLHPNPQIVRSLRIRQEACTLRITHPPARQAPAPNAKSARRIRTRIRSLGPEHFQLYQGPS